MRGASQIAAGLSALLMLGACRHAVAPTPETAVGVASYVVVPPPDEAVARAATKRGGDDSAESIESVAGDFFQAAAPRGVLAPPRYPRELRRAGARSVVVTVRVRIDADGNVREIAPSPAGFSTVGRDEALFFEAIRVAARSWRFEPAAVLHASPAAKPGAVPGLRSETVESHLDLQFTFAP